MEPEEYVNSIRLRLGCAGPCEAACQNGSLDRRGPRGLLRSRGHNAVTTRLVPAAAQSCDCTAEMEGPGLIHSTDLRPADVLTSALGNSYTALDMSICSPDSSQASSNCTQTRHEAKLAHDGPHLSCLVRQNISTSRLCGVRMSGLIEATWSPPRLSIRNFMPASPWKSGNAALGNFGLVGRFRPFRTLWTQNHGSYQGPWPSLLFWSVLLRFPSRFSLDFSFCGVRLCLFSAVSRAWFWGLAMSRAESFRRLAEQLSSFADQPTQKKSDKKKKAQHLKNIHALVLLVTEQ